MNVDPGELDQRITIQQESNVDDGMGGSTLSWATVATVWAKVRPLSGKERAQANQVEAPARYMVIMRNRTLTEAQRLKWDSNGNLLLNIRYLPREPRAQFIALEVELGVQN